ncbi:MAG: SusD/RagB family nutrient-binding outer membrane lipoprotein [Daejeonella sp.]
MKKTYITLLICSLGFAGCNKFDDEINTDPNRPSQASGTQLIANAELSLSGLSSVPAAQFMAQYLSETQYPVGSLYPDGGTSFYGLYQGPLMNLETVLKSTTLSANEGLVVNQQAVAKILKAYYMWHITDRWGDVPYTEALKGVDDFKPAYDTQQSIYNSLFALLDEANAGIATGTISNDIVYGGDMTKWKKLGNTIRLLMALRLSQVDAAKGNAEFNKALTAGIMTSNADNMVFKHLADAANQSYWFGQVVNQNREWWALTDNLVNMLKPVSDPRLAVYGKPTKKDASFTGLRFGTEVGMNVTDFSLLGAAIHAQAQQIHLVTYAQTLFARAEAAKLGWIAGGDVTAKTNYDAAIQASVLQWTGVTTGAAALITQPGVVYSPATALEQIGNQRYIHLFMNGYEAWAEWRRTGFPSNLITPKGKAIPTRNAYPPNETFTNKDNYTAAVTRALGGKDDLYGKVWWDK